MRTLTAIDKFCMHIDKVVQTLHDIYPKQQRPTPANDYADCPLSESERKHTAGLMRINHSGEVCAQALYQGQALTAKLPGVREQMQHAADEEIDHLAWCKSRLNDLNSHTSFLNPFWYAASFSMGAIAGLVGDRWSLGFVAETERQVVVHLDKHMAKLSEHDDKSKAVLTQMQIDEAKHQSMAMNAGAVKFPGFIQTLMTLTSKVMTKTAYKI